ncbi:DNA-binding transcriptional regulator YbjK [Actinoalloteichus hoggarensis]|uniref:HTH-type transcriptional repressor KstR2 n=1 Tax=Actinoalloteichus hoggarensis TaxID=1470176 RepID=A0A221W7Q2_9PSEU|nr:TetR family transcriptional regulator [Actinoalloteichus hoggarensis]ASO21666.1 HTH-type transcriptional repressor KstR2 [Actinoalloteichus hoggarensis]MBB5922259.1 DNA-binding transcriptional regulator YbjK [Actinoalloteichus hoggarensis]
MAPPARRPPDPERRDRIIEAALDVIAERGVAGTTHRRIAEAAGVPLGSMSYYFTGMDEVLFEAFSRLTSAMSTRYRDLISQARDRQQAGAAVVEIISGAAYGTPREMRLTLELYAYALRRPQLVEVMRDWMAASRASLSMHFTARTARALDALIEGLTIHDAMDATPMRRSDVAAVVDAIIRLDDEQP